MAHADKGAFLVDAANYYNAFMQAARMARQSLFILGWDLDSRLVLNREADMESSEREHIDAPAPLEDYDSIAFLSFLNDLLAKNSELQIYILNWDYSMIYALEREAMAAIKFAWQSSERLHFRFDNNHPLGASHHQKVAVIDDSIGFCGGIDLTGQRWDTRAHSTDGLGRQRPDGGAYDAFHDIQTMVSGEAARWLGQLARNRWQRACGEVIRPTPSRNIWPPGLQTDFQDVRVGLVRTDPEWEDRPSVQENLSLFGDAIARAKHSIYIENQYFTSDAVAGFLEESLHQESGPEIVIVTPKACPGWLEEATMGTLRHRIVQRLRHADKHNRLRMYYPEVEGKDIFVHAKAMVVDDRFAFVTSANLSNRSMGLDTECGMALDAYPPPVSSEQSSLRTDIMDAIVKFRNGLLAEHLGATLESVEQQLTQGSLIQTIEALQSKPRRLLPLETGSGTILDDIVPELQLDPEKPIQVEKILEDFLPIGEK
ncbi:MAG: hypothetical protein KDK37_04300 [Leptospiraceae bacterium]|nr:hypothetical protein [Leptospiraceae bacterium]